VPRFLGALAATAVALVLVLGYKTHSPLSATPVALSHPNGLGLGGAAQPTVAPSCAPPTPTETPTPSATKTPQPSSSPAPTCAPAAATTAPAEVAQGAAPVATQAVTEAAATAVAAPTAAAGVPSAAAPAAGLVAPPVPGTSTKVAVVVPVATKVPVQAGVPTRAAATTAAPVARASTPTGGGNQPPPVAVAPQTTAAAQPRVYTGKSVAVLVFLGNVQVQITVVGNQITDVKTLQLPGGSDPFSDINADVAAWRQEAIASNGQKVNSVSGATDTYNAWVASLNDAIVQAERG
jgi:uncharacterized protein with FMN-binding domain